MRSKSARHLGEIAMLGVALRNCRRRHNLSQDELSVLTGVSRAYISRIEHGLQAPGTWVLVTLSKAIPLTEILDEWRSLLRI